MTTTHEQLLKLLQGMAAATSDKLSDAAFEALLFAFCAACPDPEGARALLLDCVDPLDDEALLERVLAMPPAPTAVPREREHPESSPMPGRGNRMFLSSLYSITLFEPLLGLLGS